MGKKGKIRRKLAVNAKNIYTTYIIVAVVLVVVLAGIYYIYSNLLTSFKPEGESYQFLGGSRFVYEEGTRIVNDDGEIEMKVNGGEVETSTGTPLLYTEDKKKLTLMHDMLLMNPAVSTKVSRLLTFTTVTNEDGYCKFTLNKKSGQSSGGILYDGEDTYIFLENTTLKFSNATYYLSPLSYVVVNYNNQMEMYNSVDRTCEDFDIRDVDVKAELESGYEFNLSTDVLYGDDGESLLYSSVGSVDAMDLK